jgi:hemoglobin
MEFHISSYIPQGRPEVTLPDKVMFDILGENGIRRLVSDHYDLLADSPVRNLFPQETDELERAKQNASDFFIQVCGGPMYFNRNRGRPMMFKRHMAFKITPEDRIIWLECYRQAIQKNELPEPVARSFWNYLDIFSMWMVNS